MSGAAPAIVYLAGSARSGSTIVANVLGQGEGVFAAGELRYLWTRGHLENRRCGCGDHFTECAFWQQVQQAITNERPDLDPGDLERRIRRATRMRTVPSAIWRASAFDRRATRLGEDLAVVYHAIASVSGAQVIIDSSKLPTYGAVLARMPGVRFEAVHLVRDPRATAFSWAQRKAQPDRDGWMQQFPAWKSGLLWIVWNASTRPILRRRGVRARPLRYEDLAAAPRHSLERIAQGVGIDPDGLPFIDDRAVLLVGSHSVAGNGNRMQTGVVVLETDDRWRRQMPSRERRIVTAMAFPWLRRYHYRVVAS